MNLSNFEQFIDDVILKRGEDYFNGGHVQSMKEINTNQFFADIHGIEFYTVTITLNDREDILETECECPYNWSEFCKHQVAAFFSLREWKSHEIEKGNKPKKRAKVTKADLKTVLSNLHKEKLTALILDFASEYPDIERGLLFKYAPEKDEFTSSKKLIRECINKYKRHGFIQWNDVSSALQGAELTLEKAKEKLVGGQYENAAKLCIAVLSIVVDMIQYCDDSSGFIGDVIEECIAIIDEAAFLSKDHLIEAEQVVLCNSIMKEALHRRYEGWSDWQFSLLKVCIHFTGMKKLRVKLEKQLHSMIKGSDRSWGGNYFNENVRLLQLEIIEIHDGEEQIEQFIKENIHYSAFREKSIERLLEKGHYHEVISLCLEGEEADKEYRGLVFQWEEYRYQAYEKLGDIEKQRELGLKFVYKNEYKYFFQLKKLYQPEEWKSVLHEILETFEKQKLQPSIYVEILIHEDLKIKLFEYCKRNLSSIEEIYPYLIDEYFDEVNALYVANIKKSAGEASDRRRYKQVCNMIKAYKKIFGEEQMLGLTASLKQKYVRRPAFLDELRKL